MHEVIKNMKISGNNCIDFHDKPDDENKSIPKYNVFSSSPSFNINNKRRTAISRREDYVQRFR